MLKNLVMSKVRGVARWQIICIKKKLLKISLIVSMLAWQKTDLKLGDFGKEEIVIYLESTKKRKLKSMKVRLVADVDDKLNIDELFIDYCVFAKRADVLIGTIINNNYVEKLKKMPQKKEVPQEYATSTDRKKVFEYAYRNGFNDCLKEILGE